MPAAVADTAARTPSDCPYPELDSFSQDWSDSFFGRTEEQRVLITQVRTSRLTVLYAESGVGKSSLLRAGVTARLTALARDDYRDLGQALLVPVFFTNWKNNPLRDLRDAVAQQAGSFAQPPVDRLELPAGRLVEVLRQAADELGTTLLIVLDQFEEHLGRVRSQGGSSPFITELLECLEDPRLRASFLLGVREDAFGKVHNLVNGRVAGDRSITHLGYLTRAAAADAIRLPVQEVYNRDRPAHQQVAFGPGLVESVLDEVRHRDSLLALTRDNGGGGGGGGGGGISADGVRADEIEAPFLQLVMTRVWEQEREKKSRILQLETFRDELGGATEIVRRHLGSALQELTEEELTIATDAFRELVTPSGTKLAQTPADLARRTSHQVSEVESVLKRLDDARILRSVDRAPGSDADRYEVFHDKFTEPIQELLSRQQQERVQKAREDAEAAQGRAEAQAREETELREAADRNAQLARENAAKARGRMLLAGYFALLCLVLGVAAIVLWTAARSARNDARNSAAGAARSGLKTLAQADLTTRPDIALLLLLAARQRAAGRANALAIDDRNIAALLETTRGSGVTGILHGHSDVVESIAFSPRADILASGSADKTIRLWRVTSANRVPLGPPLKTPGSVLGVAFSPNGRTLAAATFDQVQIWDVTTDKETARYRYEPGHLVTSVAFSPTGGLVAMGTADGHLVLWAPATGSRVVIPVSVRKQVKSVAFSRDGRMVATASGSSVGLWSSSTHASLGSLSNGRVPTALAFSPTGDVLAATANRYVTLWSLPVHPPYKPVLTRTISGPGSLLYGIAFSHDGRTIAAGGGSAVLIASALTGRPEAVLNGPHGAVYGVAFSRQNTTLAAGGADRSIHLWALPVRASAGLPIAKAGRISTVAVNADNRTIVAAGRQLRRQGFIDFINAPGLSGATAHLIPVRHPVEDVAFAPHRHELAVASGGGAIQLWDATTRTLTQSWSGTPVPTVGTAGSVSSGGSVYSIAYNNDGSALASGGADGAVRLWDLQKSRATSRILGQTFGAVYAVAFNGTTVAAASADRTIHVWNLASNAPPETIPLDDAVFGLAFSHDGTSLAAAGADDTIRVWRRTRAVYELRSILLGHLALVRSVTFSPDGRTLVSGGADNSVRLWDVATGQEVGSPFTVDSGSVEGVAFGPNGRFFVSGSVDGEVRQWEAVTVPSSFAALRQQVCSFVGVGLNPAEWRAYAPNIPYQKTCDEVTPDA